MLSLSRRLLSSTVTTLAKRVTKSPWVGAANITSLCRGQFHHPDWKTPWPRRVPFRSLFIQTENTPNPESLKIIPTGMIVLEGADVNGYYVTISDPPVEIQRSPLSKELLKVEGIKAVYLGSDFVTVTKRAEYKWQTLRPDLFRAVMGWAESGKPALLDKPEITDTTIMDEDTEVVAMIKELIESRIRPAVQEDGGDIRYVSFAEDTGIVTVKLAGSCVGCPSSAVTLKQGVENMLIHYIPEVTAVEALEEKEENAVEESQTSESTENSDGKKSEQQKSFEERLAAAGIPFSD